MVALKPGRGMKIPRFGERSRNAVVALKPEKVGYQLIHLRRSRNAVVALKLRLMGLGTVLVGVKQERRGGIETGAPPSGPLPPAPRSRNAVVALKRGLSRRPPGPGIGSRNAVVALKPW